MVLENGVRIVGEEITNLRSVAIGIWIATGSRYETPQNNGISHFLEHMFFKGTDKYTAKELAQVFDGLGGQVNAFTSKEYTCFYARVLDEHFQVAIDTLADMLFHSRFPEEEIEKEKKVVIEEIGMYEDTPDELVMDLLSAGVYGNHPLGYTILGQEANLQSFLREDLTGYIQDHYTPSNMVVSVAGNVRQSEVVKLATALFGNASGAMKACEKDVMTPPFHEAISVREKDIEQVHLTLAWAGLSMHDERLYALVLMNNCLGNTSSSRLFQDIREERGMAYSVFSYHSSYVDCGMFGVYAATSPEHLDEVAERIDVICKEMAKFGMSEDELQKAKEQVKGSMMLSLESTSSRMSRLGKNELMLLREVTADESLSLINTVTREDVLQVAQAILTDRVAVSAVGPVGESEFSRFSRSRVLH